MTGAYEFVCTQASTDELFSRLHELGPWDWRIGDSYWYGDYLACVPFSGVRIRICDFPALTENQWQYQADIKRSQDCGTPLAVIDAAFRKLLAETPAHNIREIEPFY